MEQFEQKVNGEVSEEADTELATSETFEQSEGDSSLETGENTLSGEEVINATVEQIEAVKMQVAQMGANDSEIPELNSLVEQVRAGTIDPIEAGKRANEIFASKQSYH